MDVKRLRSRPVIASILACVVVSLGSMDARAWSLRDLFKTKRAPSIERKIKEVPKVRREKRLRGQMEVRTDRTLDIRRRKGVEITSRKEIGPFSYFVDLDGDGIKNSSDNCPVDANPDQADSDGDGIGDACKQKIVISPWILRDLKVISPEVIKWLSDPDNDGVFGKEDNCAFTENPNQQDSDGDGRGNACDNCNDVANPGQDDWNNDTQGDACDDSDGDGVKDNTDNCVHLANADQTDVNNNGTGDACDPECPDPELSLVVTKAECSGYGADECDWSWFEGGCDEGFDEGELVVTSGDYCIHWESENVDFVIEDCHNYGQAVNFNGDSGDICFPWDGPYPGDASPPGFEAAWLMKILPVSTAWAWGEKSTVYGRRGGVFHCTVTAYGRCGKTVTLGYWYSCTW